LEWLWEQGLIKCTDAIVPDIAGEMKLIDVAEKGMIRLKIKVIGRQAHAMNPEKGINAKGKHDKDPACKACQKQGTYNWHIRC